jgi:4-amino-4-deoxy-L-arabinose transferase-like glycosyltransferase
MTRRQRLSALVAVLLLAVFFRFYQQQRMPPGLYSDEAMDGNNAVEVVETGQWKPFYPEDNGREGLYIDTLALMYKAWPVDKPWFLRLPAEVAGVLTVAGIYLLASELVGSEMALLAAFFAATGLWPVMLSRLAFRANFCVLLLVWSLYVLLKALRAQGRGAGMLLTMVAAVLYGLGFYSYIPMRITPLLLLVLVAFFWREKGFWERAAVFVVVWLLVIAPLGLYFLHHPEQFTGRSAQLSVTNSSAPLRNLLRGFASQVAMLDFHGDREWRHNVYKAPALALPVGILFWVGFLGGARRLWRLWRGAAVAEGVPLLSLVLLYAWFFVMMVPAAAAMEVPSALRSIAVVPAVMSFAAIGGVWCYREVQRRWNREKGLMVLVSLLLLGLCVHSYVRYFHVYARDANLNAAFAVPDVATSAAINALPASTPKYVLLPVIDREWWSRDLPESAATTEFLTHSSTLSDRAARNIHYLPDMDRSGIPAGTPERQIFLVGEYGR